MVFDGEDDGEKDGKVSGGGLGGFGGFWWTLVRLVMFEGLGSYKVRREMEGRFEGYI